MKNKFNPQQLSFVATVLILLATLGLFIFASLQPRIDIENDYLRIRGLYGLTILFEDISNVEILPLSIREIGTGRRINGFNAGSGVLRGHFSSGLLFVNENTQSTIKITRYSASTIYLNLDSEYETIQLYEQIKAIYFIFNSVEY